MKKLSTKWFQKWAKKTNLSNNILLEAIDNLEKGLSTSSLGNNLYKVRIKREHSGKNSGFRTIILYKAEDRAVFLYGFGKNEKSNIDKNELMYFIKLGIDLLCLSVDNLNQAIEKNVLFDPQTIERSGTNMLVPFPM